MLISSADAGDTNGLATCVAQTEAATLCIFVVEVGGMQTFVNPFTAAFNWNCCETIVMLRLPPSPTYVPTYLPK